MNVGETVSNSWAMKTNNNSMNCTMYLNLKLVSQNIESNSSKITVSYGLYIYSTTTGQLLWTSQPQTLKIGYKNSTSGTYTYSTTQTISSYNASTGSNSYDNCTYKYSATWDVPNNNDGTLSLDVQYVWDSNGFAWAPVDNTHTIPGTHVPQIPRAASISVSPSLIEENNNMSISINAADTAHKVTVWYQVGDSTTKYNLLTKSTARTASVNWATINTRMGTNTSQAFHIFCTTYASDGTTQLGDTQQATV